MRRLLFAILCPAAVVLASSAWAQSIEAGTGRPYVVPVGPSGGAAPPPVTSKPTTLTQNPLIATSITTPGTAVTVLAAGKATAGGWIKTDNAAGLCVNDQGGVAGTITSGGTGCVSGGVPYNITPTSNAISVNSPAAVTFGGEGLN